MATRSNLTGLLLVVGSGLLWAAACGETFQSTPGGGGAAPQPCASTADCEVPSDPCQTVSCQNSECLYVQGAENVPLPSEDQIQGDCQVVVCIGGSSTAKPDNDAPPGDDCKTFTCEGTTVVQSNEANGEACGENGALTCDGEGVCIGCQSAGQCPISTNSCSFFNCVQEQCVEEFLIDQPLSDDISGDCLLPGCNGEGQLFYDADDNDVPEDPNGNDCMIPTCENGNLVPEALDNDALCSEPVTGVCCAGMCCDGVCNSSGQGTCEPGTGGAGGAGGAGVGGAAMM